uniref:transposase n=1 Tax=Anaerovorax sp. IOR16 TaxID=2773458 RepID=UPI0019D2FCDC
KKTEAKEKTKVIKKSTVDPDCGVFHKGKHKVVFAYAANVACDRNNYILAFHTNPGNVHDSVAFPKIYEKVKRYKGVKNIVMDSGYKTPAIAREILKDKRIPILPYKRPMTKNGYFKKHEYAYDEYYDCFVCPENQVLNYTTTNREGYREYKSKGEICKSCPSLSECTASKDHVKVVTRHIWENYIEQCEDIRHTPKYRDLYKLRSQTIERVFADAKEKHNMRYTQYRGIQKIEMELNLLFASMNLKKLATWIHKSERRNQMA